MEYRKGLIFILISANLVLSLYLAYTYAFDIEQFCLTGKGCSIVQNSDYAKMFGIPIAYLGVTAFTAFFLIYLLTYKKSIDNIYFTLCSILGSVFALYFIYLQMFSIKAYCSNCLATELIMFIITGIAIYDYAHR